MTDDVDRVSAREQELLADALRDQARRAGRYVGAESASTCKSCGEGIPSARQKAAPGCQFCVICLERLERRGKVAA